MMYYIRMRVAPYSFFPGLDAVQLLLHECSDRLLLPQSYADESNVRIEDVLMLTNIYNQSVCGTVYGTHDQGPSVIFAPSWMTYRLDVLEPLTISHVAKIPPVGLRIRPHSETFASNPDFIRLLNGAISNYKSLTKNTRISLLINRQIEYLTIDDIFPSKQKPEYLFKSPLKEEDYKFAFFGTGCVLGGAAVDPSVEPMQAAAAAARRRFELISRGLRPY